MQRREFLRASLAAMLPPPSTRPNIVIILCDDLGYGDPHCYNDQSRNRTPNIDRVAAEGMRFTDAHSPSAVCTPTRYGLLTGRYAWRTRMTSGVLNGYSSSLIEPGRETIASMLKKRGYSTGGFGKWHLGLGKSEPVDYSKPQTPAPPDYGFDEYWGIPASLDMVPYVYLHNRKIEEQPTGKIETNGAPPRGAFYRGGPIAPGFRMEDVLPKITSHTVEFIRAQKPGKPFFVYMALNAPHTPWVPIHHGSKAGLYGDWVEQVDASIGEVLATLDGTDTLLIVTSDNGAPWSKPDIETSGGHEADRPWRGQKADIQEAGHRIPFLVRWPGKVKAGSVSSETICLTDLFATVAAVEGVKLQHDIAEDSFNLLPAILSEKHARPIRDTIVHHSSQGLFSIRRGDWKLVLGRGSGGFTAPQKIDPAPGEPTMELYNLTEDPHEDRNMIADHSALADQLKATLDRQKAAGRSRPDN